MFDTFICMTLDNAEIAKFIILFSQFLQN